MKKLSLFVIFLLMTGSASASFFTDLQGIFQPNKALQQSVTPAMQINNYDSLMASLYKLNTPQLISALNTRMDWYKIRSSVKIHITDFNKDFYLVRNQGIVESYPYPDKTISISSKRIIETLPLFSDGKIGLLEDWQLAGVYLMRNSP